MEVADGVLLGIVAHDDAADGCDTHTQQYDTQHASDKYKARHLCPMFHIEGLVDDDEEECKCGSRGHHDG